MVPVAAHLEVPLYPFPTRVGSAETGVKSVHEVQQPYAQGSVKNGAEEENQNFFSSFHLNSLDPLQHGIGIPSGYELAYQGIKAARAADEQTSTLSLDLENSFHRMSRTFIRRVAYLHLPALLPSLDRIMGPGVRASDDVGSPCYAGWRLPAKSETLPRAHTSVVRRGARVETPLVRSYPASSYPSTHTLRGRSERWAMSGSCRNLPYCSDELDSYFPRHC